MGTPKPELTIRNPNLTTTVDVFVLGLGLVYETKGEAVDDYKYTAAVVSPNYRQGFKAGAESQVRGDTGTQSGLQYVVLCTGINLYQVL